jgi:dTDP-L-rhamnose 4-epimerase
MKNILITGGAGFIGSNLALKLIAQNYSVRVLDNLSKQIHGDNPESSVLYQSIKDKVDFMYGDVRDQSIWHNAIDTIDTIVHLASETGTGQSMYEIHRYTDVNITGTARLLDHITNNKHHLKKIIVASSRAIYGEGKYYCKNHGVVYPLIRKIEDMDKKDFEVKCPECNKTVFMLPTDELSKIHPISVYGITKQMQEDLVLSCCRSLGIPTVTFRYQNVYGPGQSLKNPYTGILSIFSSILLNNEMVNVFEDGMESRDFVYIDDVVNATIAGIETELSDCLIINVGTGISTNVLTVAKILKQLYNSSSEIYVSGNYRLGDIRHNNADITILKENLKYQPIVHFEDGIKKFSEWVKTQEISDVSLSYKKSLIEMKAKDLYK